MASVAALEKALKDAREGRLPNAIAAVRTMVQCNPKDLEAAQVLASLLADAGQFTQAIHHFSRVLTVAQADARVRNLLAPIRNNYANTLLAAGRGREAIEQWRVALAADPSYRVAYLGLTRALIECHDAAGAIEAGEQGLAMEPNWPQLSHNLANALEAAGRTEESIALLRKTLDMGGAEANVHSRLLQAINYVDLPLAESVALHRAFGARARGEWNPAVTDRDPDRPLRVGILSGDLRTHSVSFFAQSVMERRRDVAALVVFSYGVAKEGDPMRARLKALAHEWIDCGMMADSLIDRQIRDSKIDVLLDLGGHTSGGRLTALDTGPAPVVVTAIGYPNSTGHRAVGWRVVDSITDPPGAEEHSTEKLLRIDPCFLCYTPPSDSPTPVARDASAPITFGSFNLATKISPRCAKLWAEAMRAVPASRLLLKSAAMADPSATARIMTLLENAGISQDRVEVIAQTESVAEHLALYSSIDIALDTVPYNGTTTTCEALWMGVPVLTLMGDRHAARVGASLLAACGHPEWVADTPEAFASLAQSLAANSAERARLRTTLRSELTASALCDRAAYTERFHGALRHAWQSWCRL